MSAGQGMICESNQYICVQFYFSLSMFYTASCYLHVSKQPSVMAEGRVMIVGEIQFLQMGAVAQGIWEFGQLVVLKM